jgi:hypothetical protein
MVRCRDFLIALSLSVGVIACQKAANDGAAQPPGIVGAWRLVSWHLTDAEGEITYPYGESPQGQIIYTETGEMSAQLMHPGAELGDLSGLDSVTALNRIAEAFFAYYGSYTLDTALSIVTHHVRGSLAPTWVGTDQVREFEFLGNNRLQLSARLGEDIVRGENILIWERVP